MSNETNPGLIKFLDVLIDYLSRGIVPNIYCKNTILMQELFVLLNMDKKYLDYLLKTFKVKSNGKYTLRTLTQDEIIKLKFRVRGAVEYFILGDPSNGEFIKFYIGPYDYPIKIIH